MVYIHFPVNLTEEEQMLQAKYQKLKKKKKAVQNVNKKPEPEKIITKRPSDARDAREVARKLIKSGAIPAIQKKTPESTNFKRPQGPKGQERKKMAIDTPNYQPFAQPPEEGGPSKSKFFEPEKEEGGKIQNLYQQFVNDRDREERGFFDKKAAEPAVRTEKPRTGNTIYVSGKNVSEDFLKKHFGDYGTIVNISMEIEKGRGFITFSKPEATEKAIAEKHGKAIGGIQLQVQLARRQPQIEPINDASSSAVWSTLAASHSQKGNHKDKRELVVYEDTFS